MYLVFHFRVFPEGFLPSLPLGRKLSYSDYVNNAQAITFWANHCDEHWGRVSALQERLKVVLTS